MSHSQKIFAAIVAGLVVIAVAWFLFWETPGVSTQVPPATSTDVQTPPADTTPPPAPPTPAPADGGAGTQPSPSPNP